MSIILADYSDREFDIVAYHGAELNKQVLVQQVLADTNQSGEICTGIFKLAQLWLLEFFTPLGSMPYKPARGCSFMVELAAGRARSPAALTTLFALSEYQIRTNLRSEETEDDPLDERYRSGTLLGTIITSDSLALRVQLRSLADSLKLIVPVSVQV